jgi:hypothetical protein
MLPADHRLLRIGNERALTTEQGKMRSSHQFSADDSTHWVRFKLFTVLTVYLAAFLWVYETWGSPYWWYFGLQSNGRVSEACFGVALSYLSVLVLPVRIRKYSHYFVTLLFWSSVLPTYLVISRQGYPGINSYAINSLLFIAFALISKIPEFIDLGQSSMRLRLAEQKFVPFVTVLYVALLAGYLYNYGAILNFVGFGTVYDQRSLFAQQDVSIFFIYALGWLSTVFNPYFIFYGLFDRSRLWMLPLGLVGQLLIYMGFAGKSMLLVFFLYFWFYWFLLRKGQLQPERISYVYLLFVVVSFCSVYWSNGALDGTLGGISTLIYMRALTLPAALTGVYAEFFSTNPLTYFSQMNIVNLFVQYPYTEALGMVIGRYLNGGETGMNANASMWATDGISSLGPIGIVVVGVVVGTALSFINRIVTPDKLAFSAMLSTTFILNLGDSGFFTNLVTGGGFFMVFVVAFASPVARRPKVTSRSL